MLGYKEMRNVLKSSPEGVQLKYFSKDFYETFCESRLAGNWEPVYSTDFYKLDGFGYCVFQELFNASLSRWRLTFGKWDAGYPIDIDRRYIRADSEAEAKAFGMDALGELGAEYVEVLKVK